MTVLEIINEALAESGFNPVSSVYRSPDVDARQLAAIMNRARSEIRDFYIWPTLRSEFTLTLVEGNSVYSLPNDFWAFVPESCWSPNGSQQIEWPTPVNEWFMYKNSTLTAGPKTKVRLVGNRRLQVAETPSVSELRFDYISCDTVLGAEGDSKKRFDHDSDTYLLNDRVLQLGFQAHWATTKGLPQAGVWTANYFNKMNAEIGRVTGARVIGSVSQAPRRGAPYYPLFRP